MNKVELTREEWGRIGDEGPNVSPDLLLEYGKLILLHQGGE